MDGCRVTLLGFLELNGGIRLIFEEGVALRARGRLVFEGDILGVGGGTSFLLDVEGSFGWNPLNIRCRVEVAGSIWFEIAGRKFGLESPGLPRLTARDDPARTFDEVRVALDQPFGPAPEEM